MARTGPTGVQYTLTAGAVALSASTILNDTAPVARLTIRNATGAANALYLGSQVVANTPTNAWVQLAAGESITILNAVPAQIFIVGTVNAANIAFVLAEYGARL